MAVGEHRPGPRAMEALAGAEFLDAPAKKVGKSFRGKVGPGALKDAASGTWLGHALHPMLTDVVIGSFTSATLLDIVGGDRDGKAAERLIAVGIAAYGPTAFTGTNDWADTELGDERSRRIGLVHAATNATALGLYVASLAARRRGATRRGKLLGMAGAAVLGGGGYLGGHLSLAEGVGASQTAFDTGPADWTDALAADELTAGEPKVAVVGDTPVMLLRHAHGIHALHDRCSHRGCSLAGSKIEGESVVCFCHGSTFRLADGAIERGPATTAQPSFETREADGRIEVRLRG